METRESNNVLLSDVKRKLSDSKKNILNDVERVLDESFSYILASNSNVSKVEKNVYEDRTPNIKRKQELPIKVFVAQNSVLTDLWKIPHIDSAYNICTALFILLLAYATLLYAADSKRYDEDIEFLIWIVKDAGIWVSIWLFMKFSSIIIFFPFFRYWSVRRTPSSKIKFFDKFFTILLITYFALLTYLPALKVLQSDLSPVVSFFIVVEQTRIAMKVYAFVRENVPKVLKFKPHKDDDDNKKLCPCPDFNKFLYFLFVPTIVYRDEYPRTKKIRWEYVAWNFIQVLATIVLTFICFRRFVVEIFYNVGQEPFTPTSFILTMSGAIVVGAMSMFAGFYGLLHCWMNAYAEMLTFADRLFYKDWWNCTTFAKYYRTWNMVIHDWLYSYIYRDLYVLLGYRQTPAMVGVFFLSAIIHEYILSLTLKYLYPVLFVMFLFFGVIVVFLTRKKTSSVWNIFLWLSLFQGWGILIVLYSMEWYSRKNCPNLGFKNGFFELPRSWTCKVLHIPFFIVNN